MKNLLPSILLALALCAGCSTHYRVTLSNGSYYTTLGKPRLDKTKNRYVFKDATTGKQLEVSPLSIREIAPQSEAETESRTFLPTPGH